MNMRQTAETKPEGSNKFSNRPCDVLIVEDDADDTDLFLRTLQKVQMGVDTKITAHVVSNGIEASELFGKKKFDAIFLDINMLPPDGMELARRVRSSEINRATPIVIITGGEERGLMTRAFQAGAHLFLFKPIDRAQLLRLIQVLLAPHS
jgi:CheY-like chemotaxis protein